MPNKVFENISNEKRNRIIDVSISEFAKYGYDNASTLQIVVESGISKGSLFKYFTNKESLYFYILDITFAEYEADMKQIIYGLSPDIIELVVEYASSEFEWYLKNPNKFNIILEATKNTDSSLYEKIIDRYAIRFEALSNLVFSNAKENHITGDNTKFQNIIKWTLEGFNADFRQKNNLKNNQEYDLALLKKDYITQINVYLKLLKEGITYYGGDRYVQ